MSDDDTRCRQMRYTGDPMVVFHARDNDRLDKEWIRFHESLLVDVQA